MAIAKELLVVSVTIAAQAEDDWNRWYNEVHLPEIAACPGFRSAQRYVSEEAGARRYMTLYEIDGPQALQTAEFAARRGWGPFGAQVEFKTACFSRVAAITAQEA